MGTCMMGSKYTHRFCPGVLIFRALSCGYTGLEVDLAASVKVIPASQLGWRDGCNGYDDGALVFRLIQAEQSRGVSRSVIRDAEVIS